MDNIKQITNFDLSSAATTERAVRVGGDTGEDRLVTYKVIGIDILGGEITKWGYCCEPLAMKYPIFLTVDGKEDEFQIDKTGMLENEIDTWKNLNDDEAEDDEEQEIEVWVSEVKVPWFCAADEREERVNGYNFTFDYICPVG